MNFRNGEVIAMSELMTDEKAAGTGGENQKLSRGIQSWHVSLIALGGIIGSCYFLGSGYTVAEVGPAAAFAYAIGGFVVYSVMMSFGELLVNLPRRGSFVSYSKEFMGPSVAAGVGWSYWVNWIAYCPAEALACGLLMNHLVPWNQFGWAVVFMAVITLINLYQVKWFGHIESILALIKVLAVAVFSLAAIGIIFGLIGGHPIGFSIVLNEGKTSVFESLFPYGGFVVLTTMVMILVNYQGSEIVGLAAAETQNPEINVPKACRTVTYRIIGIYVIPLFLLVMVLPYSEAGLQDSVFSTALGKYGLHWAATIFTIVTMVAAFSCANSGLYGTVRALYSLSVEGLAPKAFMRLNKYNVPQLATIFTIILMWFVLAVGYFMPNAKLYSLLLSMSGFTGSVCWMSINASQMLMRRKLKRSGYEVKEALKARTPLYPFLPLSGFLIMAFGLIFMVCKPDLRPVLMVVLPAIIVPMIVHYAAQKAGKTRTVKLDEDEIAFEERYPSKYF